MQHKIEIFLHLFTLKKLPSKEAFSLTTTLILKAHSKLRLFSRIVF